MAFSWLTVNQSSWNSDKNDTVGVCSILYFKTESKTVNICFCIYHLNISFLMQPTNVNIACTYKLPVSVLLLIQCTHTGLTTIFSQSSNHSISQILFNCPLPGCKYSYCSLHKVYPVSHLCVAACYLSVIQERIQNMLPTIFDKHPVSPNFVAFPERWQTWLLSSNSDLKQHMQERVKQFPINITISISLCAVLHLQDIRNQRLSQSKKSIIIMHLFSCDVNSLKTVCIAPMTSV